MKEFDKMIAGQYYHANDPELGELRKKAHQLAIDFNNTQEYETEKRSQLIKELLGKVGKNCWIEPNIRVDYGQNVFLGDRFYANFDCIFLDCAPITFGNDVFIGPRVCFYTACHPIHYLDRNQFINDKGVLDDLEYAKPISVGSNVWIGGSTVILPGVTIGDNVVIGAGSVVTKSLPSNVVAVGNPCHVIREITDQDYVNIRKDS